MRSPTRTTDHRRPGEAVDEYEELVSELRGRRPTPSLLNKLHAAFWARHKEQP
jgi:hypothetical protein